jgi:hypothetical protein
MVIPLFMELNNLISNAEAFNLLNLVLEEAFVFPDHE